MKRTTYIFIGTFLGGMLLIFLGIFFLKDTPNVAEETSSYTVTPPAKVIEMDISDVHTLKFKGDYPLSFSYDWGKIEITQTANSTSGKIVLPSAEYIKTEKKDGVLVVDFDFRSLLVNNGRENSSHVHIEAFDVFAETSANLMRIENELQSNIIVMKGILTDSLSLSSKSQVTVEESEIGALSFAGKDIYFSGNNLSITDLYLDLDAFRNFELSNSVISTQHLTGSGKAYNWSSYGGQIRNFVWNPTDDKAQLMLSFNAPAKIAVQN